MTRDMALRFPYQRQLRRDRIRRRLTVGLLLLGLVLVMLQAVALHRDRDQRSEVRRLYGRLYAREIAGRQVLDSASNVGPDATVVVGRGDTLWAIAERNFGTSGDVRNHVTQIAQTNGLTSYTLRPGQKLILPR